MNFKPAPDLNILERFHRSPLKQNEIVRFQGIRRGPSCSGNYRLRLDADGTVYVQVLRDGEDCKDVFKKPFPEPPSHKLSAAELDGVKTTIAEQKFFSLPAGLASVTRFRDGAMSVIDIQLDGKIHTVAIEIGEHPVTNAIWDKIMAPVRQ